MQVIRREAANVAGDKENWKKELRRELEDARDEHENLFDAKMSAYNQRIDEWREINSKPLTFSVCGSLIEQAIIRDELKGIRWV